MTSALFAQASWVAVATDDVERLARAIGCRRLAAVVIDAPFTGPTLSLVPHDGWVYVFGPEAGLGALGAKLASTYPQLLSFHVDAKRDTLICTRYQRHARVAEYSDIQGEVTGDARPKGGALHERALDLATQWGADPRRVPSGTTVHIERGPILTRRGIAIAVSVGLVALAIGALLYE